MSILEEDDPDFVRQKYMTDYEKYSVEKQDLMATKPRFKFYMYNDEGNLVQENLSIHDIQHFLLHSTLRKRTTTTLAPPTPAAIRQTQDAFLGVLGKVQDIMAEAAGDQSKLTLDDVQKLYKNPICTIHESNQ